MTKAELDYLKFAYGLIVKRMPRAQKVITLPPCSNGPEYNIHSGGHR